MKWMAFLGGLVGAPLAVVVWQALVARSAEAETFLWIFGGLLVFICGGVVVLLGQHFSMKVNSTLFSQNADENKQIVGMVTELLKQQKANAQTQAAAYRMQGPSAGPVYDAQPVQPVQPQRAVVVKQGAFDNLH